MNWIIQLENLVSKIAYEFVNCLNVHMNILGKLNQRHFKSSNSHALSAIIANNIFMIHGIEVKTR